MSQSPVTELLRAWSGGDEAAFGALLPLVEAELRRLARGYMARSAEVTSSKDVEAIQQRALAEGSRIRR